MLMRTMETYNGHPIVKNMPAPRLFRTKNEEAVRIALKFDKSPIGTADIYVHKNCVSHVGGDSVDAKFDVLLVDNKYKLYYPQKDRVTGMMTLRPSEQDYLVEDICKLMEITKKNYEAHPIKRRTSLLDKIRGTEFDDIIECEHNGMIYPEYVK